MDATLPGSVAQQVGSRFESVGGRRRLQATLYGIAVDIVCPQARLELRPADYDWLLTALGDPIERATSAGVDVFLERIEVVLQDAPPTLMADLERVRYRGELGCE